MCVGLCMCILFLCMEGEREREREKNLPVGPGEFDRSHKDGIMYGCVLPDVCSGNPTQVI